MMINERNQKDHSSKIHYLNIINGYIITKNAVNNNTKTKALIILNQ